MKKLVKKGDTRHVINLPATRDVEAEAGNIFGVKYEEAIETPAEPETQEAPETLEVTGPKKRFSWLRMPLFVRLWGRS